MLTREIQCRLSNGWNLTSITEKKTSLERVLIIMLVGFKDFSCPLTTGEKSYLQSLKSLGKSLLCCRASFSKKKVYLGILTTHLTCHLCSHTCLRGIKCLTISLQCLHHLEGTQIFRCSRRWWRSNKRCWWCISKPWNRSCISKLSTLSRWCKWGKPLWRKESSCLNMRRSSPSRTKRSSSCQLSTTSWAASWPMWTPIRPTQKEPVNRWVVSWTPQSRTIYIH